MLEHALEAAVFIAVVSLTYNIALALEVRQLHREIGPFDRDGRIGGSRKRR